MTVNWEASKLDFRLVLDRNPDSGRKWDATKVFDSTENDVCFLCCYEYDCFFPFSGGFIRILKTVRNIRLGVWWTRFPVISYLANQHPSNWLPYQSASQLLVILQSVSPPPPPQCIKWERRMEVTCFSESHMNVSTVAMYGFWLWRKTLHFNIDCL